MKKILFIITLSAIFLLAFFLRFNALATIPNGLEQDETSIGYNAYNILQTGKDEYGKAYPLEFKAFGEYKLPGYIYATIFPIRIFGLNALGVRFVSAFSGWLTVVLLYFLVAVLTRKKYSVLGLFSSLLLAVNPWHLQLSRGAFETTLALFFIVLGTLLWVIAVEKKQILLFFLSVIALIGSVYTYNIAKVFTPLLIICLFILYKNYFLKSKKTAIAIVIFVFLLLIPFVLQLGESSGIAAVKGTLITSSAVTQAPLIEMRNYMNLVLPSFFVKLFFNIPLQTLWKFFNNLAIYLSVEYLFISGSTHGNHGIGTSGQFYLFELPLMVVGIVEIFRKKYSWGKFLLAWIILNVAVASFTRDVPQATRSFFIVVPLEIISGLGLIVSYQFLRQWKKNYLAYAVMTIFCLIISVNLIYYFASYYIRFPIAYAPDWRSEDQAVSLYIVKHQNEYNRIIFDNKAGFEYTSFLFYTKYSPTEFQQTVKRAPDDSEGFSAVLSFGKYTFRDIDWSKDYQPGVMIITTPNNKPADVPALETFSYPMRQNSFAVGNDVISYPVTDVAYVIVAKK